jgi:integrase
MAKTMKGVTSISRNGVEYWYARVDGNKVYCGKGDKGKELAQAARSKEVAKRYENREVRAGLQVKKSKLRTVQELSNWYMALPTVQEKKGYYRKVNSSGHLLKYFSKTPVNQVEGDDQEQYREWRRGEGAADGTIDNEIELLSAMYHLALKRKKIHADAMPGEFVIKRETNPRRRITDEQFEELLKHATADFRDVLICGYESAMRSSEIASLTARQVHLDEATISQGKKMKVSYLDLGIFDTKTGARRTVPVSEGLKEVLGRRLEGLGLDDYVFTHKGRKYSNAGIVVHMKNTCKWAKVPYGDKTLNAKGERLGVVFHCLRHTRTSKWIEMGLSDEIIRRATGHMSLEAYKQYVDLDPAVVMKLVDTPETKTDNSGIKTAESIT